MQELKSSVVGAQPAPKPAMYEYKYFTRLCFGQINRCVPHPLIGVPTVFDLLVRNCLARMVVTGRIVVQINLDICDA